MCILMGIDLSGKFSSKTKKAILLLGEALGLGPGKPIKFKSKINASSVNRDDKSAGHSDEQVNIKNVKASTTAAQLKANIQAMVENVNTINDINLIHFFGKNGILACLSNSSFTSSSSNFKKIYKNIGDKLATQLLVNDQYLTSTDIEQILAYIPIIRHIIITYLNLKKRNNYKDSASKFDDGGTIDKCKVVACHTLLLGLKQKEERLITRQQDSQQSPQSSSSSNSISQYTPLEDLNTKPSTKKDIVNRAFYTELKKIQSIHPQNESLFIYAYDTAQTDELITTLTKAAIKHPNPEDITIYTLENRKSLNEDYKLKFIYIPKTSSPTTSNTAQPPTTYDEQSLHYLESPCLSLIKELNKTNTISIFVNTKLFKKVAQSETILTQIHRILSPEIPQDLSSKDHPYKPNCPEENFINAMSATTITDFLNHLNTTSTQRLIRKAPNYIIVTVKPSGDQFEMPCLAAGEIRYINDLDASLEKRPKYIQDPDTELGNICQNYKAYPVIFVKPDLFDSIVQCDLDAQPRVLKFMVEEDNTLIQQLVPQITQQAKSTTPFPRSNIISLTKDLVETLMLPEIKNYISTLKEQIENELKQSTDNITPTIKDYPDTPVPNSLTPKSLTTLQELWKQIQTSKPKSKPKKQNINGTTKIKKGQSSKTPNPKSSKKTPKTLKPSTQPDSIQGKKPEPPPLPASPYKDN